MKKILKIALLMCVMALSMTSVSAATHIPLTATSSLDGTTVTIELPSGTYPAGTNELGARAGVVCPSPGVPGNVASQSSLPWYLLGTFNLSATEVATLKTTSITKQVSTLFDFGCSDLQIRTGTGNLPKYTGSTTPTTPTTPTLPNTGLDLSPYSAMNMIVYSSSRVTDIIAKSNGFQVKGYMFEANANCTINIWREIVFVNVNDASTKSAYRVQTVNIRNPWLNSNPNATSNYRYDLSYANYEVTVNPNNVNAYVGNVPGQKMKAGTYYVYMRISNGKTSYLFPLRDVTLTNGTNLENTGKLPAGFKVYDASSRAMTYTVGN